MPDYEGVFKERRGPVLGSDAPGTGPGNEATGKSAGSGKGINTPQNLPIGRQNDAKDGYGGGGIASEGTIPPAGQAPEGPYNVGQQLADLLQRYPPGPAVPQYNKLYDTLRSLDGWRYSADIMLSGTLTAPGAGNSVVPTTLTIPTNQPMLRLSQYPGALQAYIYIRTFSATATGTTMTGVLDWFMTDLSGFSSAPLGHTPVNGVAAGLISVDALLLAPLIDATNTTVGTLNLNAIGIGGTATTIAWRLALSYVYLTPTPAFKGYVPDPLGLYRSEGTDTPLESGIVGPPAMPERHRPLLSLGRK